MKKEHLDTSSTFDKSYHLNIQKSTINEYLDSYINQEINLSKLIVILNTIDSWADTETKFHKNLAKTLKVLETTVREKTNVT